MTDDYFDDTMVNRARLLWTIAIFSRMRWVWSRLWSFRVENAQGSNARQAGGRKPSYRRASMNSQRLDTASKALAPLRVGDRLPWRLNHQGEPQWFFGTLTRVGSSAQICKRR